MGQVEVLLLVPLLLVIIVLDVMIVDALRVKLEVVSELYQDWQASFNLTKPVNGSCPP